MASNQLSTSGLPTPLNNTPKLTLFFGHGHLVTYSIFWQKLYSNEKGSKQITKRGKWHAYSTLLVLLLLSGDIQLNPGPVASLSPVQNVQLKTAETTLVRHVNTGGTEPMDFFHMESFADLPRANSDFTSHPDNQSIREHWTQLKQCRCSMFPQKRRNPRTRAPFPDNDGSSLVRSFSRWILRSIVNFFGAFPETPLNVNAHSLHSRRRRIVTVY